MNSRNEIVALWALASEGVLDLINQIHVYAPRTASATADCGRTFRQTAFRSRGIPIPGARPIPWHARWSCFSLGVVTANTFAYRGPNTIESGFGKASEPSQGNTGIDGVDFGDSDPALFRKGSFHKIRLGHLYSISCVEEVTAVQTKSPTGSWSLSTTTGRRLDESISEDGNRRSTTSPARYIVPNLILGGAPDRGHATLLEAFHNDVPPAVSSSLGHEVDEVQDFIHRFIWNILQVADYGLSVCHGVHGTHSPLTESTLVLAVVISRSRIFPFIHL